MTPTDLDHLRGVLEARQTELEDLLRKREGIAADSCADMLDQIRQASERDLAIGNLERESARLREVRAALRRFHLGTFGICLDCEEEVSLNQLSAVPWTALCLVCRETADRSRIWPGNTIERRLLNNA